MIKTQNLVPQVYYNRSRDFQLLGRTYDIIFNYLKTNSDTIYNNPLSEDTDNELVSLVASTLGFKEVHEYNTKQLRALCSAFSNLLRNKGTKKSIEDLLNLLLNVEKNKDTSLVEDPVIIDEENHLVTLYIPTNITDTSLLEDVLNYILPVGISYRLIKELVVSTDNISTKLVVGNDRTSIYLKTNNQFIQSQVKQVNEDDEQTSEDETDYITKSSDPRIGGIEDLVIVRPEKYDEANVKQNQSDEDAPEIIYPKDEE